MKQLTNGDFAKAVHDSPVAIVKFYADRCAPCRSLDAAISGWRHPRSVRLFKVDIERSPDLANEMHVMSIPTLIIYKQGEEHTRAFGTQRVEQLDELVR